MTPESCDPAQQDRYIAIWSKAVDTQMHFNELSVKSRQLGVTSIVAALGVAIVLVSRGKDFAFVLSIYDLEFQLHISVLLFIGAFLALQAVKILDLNVYHKMLRGAVAFGEDFEERYMKKIFDLEKGMTQAISHFSRHGDAKFEIHLSSETGQYTGSDFSTAEQKIKNFYKWTSRVILIGSLLMFIVTNFSNFSEMLENVCTEDTAISSKKLD